MQHLVGTRALWAVALACFISASFAIFADSPADEPPRYCTVFHHFVKSGGTAVKLPLKDACKEAKNRRPVSYTGITRIAPQMRLDMLHNASVIVGFGEMIREPLKATGRDCEYFTMMRHPIDRLISMFYYCPTDHDIQIRPPKFCGDYKGDADPIQDRLLEFATKYCGNRAFRSMLDAVFCTPLSEFCDAEHARQASLRPKNINTPEGWLVQEEAKRVLSSYTAVGIFEEWELSMRLFDANVKSPVRNWDPDYKANGGTKSAARQELLEWAYTNEELHSLIAADLLLYDYALAVFRQQTKDARLLWT